MLTTLLQKMGIILWSKDIMAFLNHTLKYEQRISQIFLIFKGQYVLILYKLWTPKIAGGKS